MQIFAMPFGGFLTLAALVFVPELWNWANSLPGYQVVLLIGAFWALGSWFSYRVIIPLLRS
jgi:hypothetical protein